MTAVPPEAITAAAEAIEMRRAFRDRFEPELINPAPHSGAVDLATAALIAAAPVLVADSLKAAARKQFEDAIRAATDEAITPKLEAIRDAAAAAERERLAALIPPERLRQLADWFDTDDEFKTTMFPAMWPHRGSEVQKDLRQWADLLDGKP